MQEIDALFVPYAGSDVPGCAVLVVRHGDILVEQGYGLADLDRGVPVTAETNFRLASVTKQFTAYAVLQLVESGALSLDERLTDLFDGFPAYGQGIRVRDLLTHTSGLLDYEDLMADTATVQVLDRDVLAMMASVDSTYFPPGTAYRYSNSGYAVLAMAVERRSGERFADYLRRHLFEPIGMTNTVAFEQGISTVPHRAFGYRPEEGGFAFADQSPTSAVLGDGGIYSSLRDLARWDETLYGSPQLSDELLGQAFTPTRLAGGDTLDYGFGWRIDEVDGHRRLHHSGSTSGFRNVIQRYPDERLTIVVLSNRSEPPVDELAERLADLFLDP